MATDDELVLAAVRSIGSKRQATLGSHVACAALVDYTMGAMPAADVDATAEHLAVCRDCARAALELSSWFSAATTPEARTHDDARHVWNRLVQGGDQFKKSRGRARALTVHWLAVAAAITASVAGWLLGHMGRGPGAFPVKVAAIAADLTPVDPGRAGGEDDVVVRANEHVIVLLTPPVGVRAGDVWLEVVDEHDRRAWAGRASLPNDFTPLLLDLPPGRLQAGRWIVRWRETEEPSGRVLATYGLRLSHR